MPTYLDPTRDRHVRRTGDDYLAPFMRLLPQGLAWQQEDDSVLVKVCKGLSYFWGFVDGRAADLLEIESDPRKTRDYILPDGTPDGLLPDWERNWGLPDPCFPDAITVEERQRMLVFKMTLLGAQSRAWFEYVSEWNGDTIHITEFSPYMTGVSVVGDTIGLYDNTGVSRWQLGPPEIRYYWTARAAMPELIWFRCGYGGPQEALKGEWEGGEVGIDHMLEINVSPDLDCLLTRWRPAHTELVYDYSQLVEGGPLQGTP